MYSVYILKCRDARFYVGYTSDLEDRLEKHRKGNIPATRDRLPIELFTFVSFKDKYKAYDFEKYLKLGNEPLLLPILSQHPPTPQNPSKPSPAWALGNISESPSSIFSLSRTNARSDFTL